MSDVYTDSVELHRKHMGKLNVVPALEVKDRADLSLVYTPGVAQVCREVASDSDKSFELTWRGRVAAIISDGSAVLGLGNIGPEAAMPVMEGKALLMQKFGGISAVPIVTDAHTVDELVNFVKRIAPSFGAINLEDIAAPTCIDVEDALQDIGIPVTHDDQHGTAIVVTAAIHNAAKVLGKKYEDLIVVISGAGAAGLAVAQMLLGVERQNGRLERVSDERVREVRLVDSKGVINLKRGDMTGWKMAFAELTNESDVMGGLAEAVVASDVFVGVSKGGLLKPEMVKTMNSEPVIFAMANPDPEIMPDEAIAAGAAIVGTGRSDFANQINNSLSFPGLFRGALDSHATKFTWGMKQAASKALAEFVEPTREKVLPSMFDEGLAEEIARAVADRARIEKVTR